MRASQRCAAVLLPLLSLCARAAGNGIHVGDGLYSGGTALFDLNASACPSHCGHMLARMWGGSSPPHAPRKRERLAPRGIPGR